MDSISSTNPVSNALANDYSSLADAVAGSSSEFSSLFSQAMSAATTPSQQAQVAFDEAEYNNINVLSSMADGSSSGSSDLSSLASLASLLGGNPTTSSIPAWETDLANLLGPNSAAAQALNTDQQASLLSQSMLNGDLNSLGSTFDSLM